MKVSCIIKGTTAGAFPSEVYNERIYEYRLIVTVENDSNETIDRVNVIELASKDPKVIKFNRSIFAQYGETFDPKTIEKGESADFGFFMKVLLPFSKENIVHAEDIFDQFLHEVSFNLKYTANNEEKIIYHTCIFDIEMGHEFIDKGDEE